MGLNLVRSQMLIQLMEMLLPEKKKKIKEQNYIIINFHEDVSDIKRENKV